MTIAAGIHFREGVLLCADSMYSGGDLKVSRSKIFTSKYEEGCTVFALAGHEGYAKLAVQDAQERIAAEKGRRSIKAIKNIVGNAVKAVYVDHIDKRPYHEQYDSQIELLFGVWSDNEGVKLFVTKKTAAIQVDTYDCIGSGAHLGHYIIGPAYDWKLNQRQSLTLAIHALTVAKDNDPNCGGESEIRILLNDGTITPPRIWGQKLWKDSAEETLREFDGAVRKLLLTITDPAAGDEGHRVAVNSFGDRMDYVRESWLAFIRGAETYAVPDPSAPHESVIHYPVDLPPEKEGFSEG